MFSLGPKTAEIRSFFTGVVDRRTDRRTDGPTDRPSDRDTFMTNALKKDFVIDGPTDQWINKKWPIQSHVLSLKVRGLKICNIIEGGVFFMIIFIMIIQQFNRDFLCVSIMSIHPSVHQLL